MGEQKAGKGLDWLSLALEAVELVAPPLLERMSGDDEGDAPRLPSLGMRDLKEGWAYLTAPIEPEGMWAHVQDDATDLGVLTSLAPNSSERRRVAYAVGMVIGAAGFELLVAQPMEMLF